MMISSVWLSMPGCYPRSHVQTVPNCTASGRNRLGGVDRHAVRRFGPDMPTAVTAVVDDVEHVGTFHADDPAYVMTVRARILTGAGSQWRNTHGTTPTMPNLYSVEHCAKRHAKGRPSSSAWKSS
jgi:hypothetical protein